MSNEKSRFNLLERWYGSNIGLTNVTTPTKEKIEFNKSSKVKNQRESYFNLKINISSHHPVMFVKSEETKRKKKGNAKAKEDGNIKY